ncbi:MAG: hypothetical protein U1F52_07140 [Burkholderiales bacterium]
MRTPTNHDDRLAMLFACGSPGSAAAYHQLAPEASTGMPANKETLASWFARLLRPFRESAWERELRDREAFLSRAQNVLDVEARMRTLEDAALGRSRALG